MAPGRKAARLHEKPNRSEIAACRLWLDAEIGPLKPQVVVCLGATAAQALIAPSFKVTQQREKLIIFAARASRDGDGPPVVDPPSAR